jgi:hypothetical protein
MGLNSQTVRFLLARREQGASFEKCATVGRHACFIGRKEMASVLREFGLDPAKYPELRNRREYPWWSEPVWAMLGTKELVSIDASNFEGASLIHDMNLPIPAHLDQHFDAVCDAGTLEHIFNYPQAMRNCLEMVKLGGHFFSQTAGNNYMGHGFYQFSPELLFRILSAKNGYAVERMVAVEQGPLRRSFDIADPEAVRQRVNLMNFFPVNLLVWAKRTAIVPILKEAPQQSDYVSAWSSRKPQQETGRRKGNDVAIARLKRFLIETTPSLARMLEAFLFSPFNREYSFRNRRSFTRVKKW